MKKVKSKIKQDAIVASVKKDASKAELTKLTAFCVDHLCGCKSPRK